MLLKFSATIKLIALPPMSDANKTFGGVLATISGFGRTDLNGGFVATGTFQQQSQNCYFQAWK